MSDVDAAAPTPDMVYLIDAYSLIFQVFHAIPTMTSPSGQPTNALFGISRDLVAILRNHQAAWVICAWDSKGPGTRSEVYAEYKANRSETPDDLIPQIPLIHELFQAFGIPVIEHAGWEADDVIATLTKQAVARDLQVRIVTTDKDARQLIGPRVHMYNLRKNTILDEAALLADWGIRPDQVVDFQSLVGDAVDNVPGVPLIGPKKAAQLLNQFGTLDDVLARADDAPGAKLRENLKTYADQARLSRELVRLHTDLPIAFDWDATRQPKPNVPLLQSLFRGFGFRALINDVRVFDPTASPAPPAPPVKATAKLPREKSLFADEESETTVLTSTEVAVTEVQVIVDGETVVDQTDITARRREFAIVDTAESLAALVERIRGAQRICLDLETTSLDPRRAKITGWAFFVPSADALTAESPTSSVEAFYVPVLGPEGSRLLDPPTVAAAFKPLLEDPARELVNQNIKYDLIVLRTHGIEVPSLGVDPMIADYLLDAGARSHSLETLIDKYLHRPSISITELIGTGKNQKSMDQVPVAQVAEYATEDADTAFELAHLLGEQLRTEGLWDLYWNLERPLIPVLAELEFNGIKVNVEELRRQSEEVTHELERLVTEIHELAGSEFNIDSPIQLRKVLFEDHGLPVKKRTKTGPSTDQDVLEELALLHPLPAKIIEHRHLSKLKGTYLDALPELVNPETGRIHCSFNQVVAATGRLSSSDPNLQNIPIRTPAGRRIRKAFVPGSPGWKLVSADYSQIELRMLAHFSQDAVLLDAFARGVDIHTAVAADVYGIPLDSVDAEMRRVAKAVNFGVIYGQSPFGLAAALGIEKEAAARFIDEYFARYAGVDRFLEEVLATCEQSGYARTILGRRRRIEGIRPDRTRNRNLAERTAINSVIQGSAADLIKRAMINVHARMQQWGHPGRMLLQIHDELVFESPAHDVPSLIELVRTEMEGAMALSVPLVVDVSVGENWLD